MNLVPIVLDRLEKGQSPVVFGDGYDTPDGTCIRDYVHVLDLAHAHIAALDYLRGEERPHRTFNVGTGEGSSVLEVIDAIARAQGIEITPRSGGPRRGPGAADLFRGSHREHPRLEVRARPGRHRPLGRRGTCGRDQPRRGRLPGGLSGASAGRASPPGPASRPGPCRVLRVERRVHRLALSQHGGLYRELHAGSAPVDAVGTRAASQTGDPGRRSRGAGPRGATAGLR